MSIVLLYVMGVHKRSVQGKINLYNALQTKKPFIVVFNHPTFYEPLVLYNILNIPLRFVSKHSNLKGAESILKQYKLIYVNETKGTIKQILEAIPNSTIFGTVAIAPAGGSGFEKDPTFLPEFKTGAFVPMIPVLPVLIRYSHHEIWEKGVPVSSIFWKRISGPRLYYDVSILPMIYPPDNQSPIDFSKTTHQIMQQELIKL